MMRFVLPRTSSVWWRQRINAHAQLLIWYLEELLSSGHNRCTRRVKHYYNLIFHIVNTLLCEWISVFRSTSTLTSLQDVRCNGQNPLHCKNRCVQLEDVCELLAVHKRLQICIAIGRLSHDVGQALLEILFDNRAQGYLLVWARSSHTTSRHIYISCDLESSCYFHMMKLTQLI